ncbi:MAG: hypothetical protein IPO05_15675 [Flavobacteriales bacterium]|jgi:hypothetical protein|nr:hypothetical protein [Flavobacteriales bacterium]
MDRITTRLADMMITEDGKVIEVHYREGLDLDVEGLMEVQLRRCELTTERCAMIGFFQAGTLSDLEVMKVDYFGLTNANEQLTALAIVTEDDLGASMSSIYYTYHPQTFPTRIFRSGDEARAWVKEVMA